MIREFRMDSLPMPKTKRGVLAVLRKILAKPYIESIVITNGAPIEVSWHAGVDESFEDQETVLRVDEILAKIVLEELQGAGSARELFVEALLYVAACETFPVGIVVQSVKALKDAFNIPQVMQLPRIEETATTLFAGLVVAESSMVERDSFVVLAAMVPAAPLDEATLGVRFVV